MAVISAKDQLIALFNAANSGLSSPLTLLARKSCIIPASIH